MSGNEIRPQVAQFDRSQDERKFLRDELGPGWRSWSRYNRDWFLDNRGSMLHCSGYLVPSIRIEEDDWPLHLMEKVWFDANTFLPAYFEAVRRRGLKTLNIRVSY